MTKPAVDELCRITVVTDHGRADIAIPARIRVGEALPAILRLADPDLASQKSPETGWALQRIGEEPFDDDSQIDALGLADGEIVYLSAREASLPPITFDDLVDGVASAIKDRPDAWRPLHTRRLFLGLAATLLAATWVGLLHAGAPGARAGAAGLAAIALVGAGSLFSRVLGKRAEAVLTAMAGLPFGALAGFLVSVMADESAARSAEQAGWFGFGLGPVDAPDVMLAGGVAAAVGLVALVLVDLARGAFLVGVITAVGASLGGLLCAWLHLSSQGSAGVIGVVTLGLTVAAPTAATRMARMRLPMLPSHEDELPDAMESTVGREILTMSDQAHVYLSSFCVAAGVISAACIAILAVSSRMSDLVLAATLGCAFLLRSRVYISVWQRLSAVLPGVVAGLAVLSATTRAMPFGQRPYLLLATSAATAGLLFAASYLPGRRLLPFWGRCADVLETASAVATVPILLQVLGLYGRARGMSG